MVSGLCRAVVVVTGMFLLFPSCQPTAGYRSSTVTGGTSPPPQVPEMGGAPAVQPSAPRPRPRVTEPACTRDDDCVPGGCCHPSTCVPRTQAPDCSEVICTQECRPGTLDCGGRCACEGGVCVAHFPQGLAR